MQLSSMLAAEKVIQSVYFRDAGKLVKFVPPTAAFESIESAQEYLALLSQVIQEARQSIEADIAASKDPGRSRQLEALCLIGFKLEKLASHIKTSRRILNDLRMLRRVLQQREVAE